MGSVTMALRQVFMVMILFLGLSIEESQEKKKPAVVDWEKANFGIRTSHSHKDGLNNVNIDRNAPHIPKRVKPIRHEARKKVIKPTITRNKLRIRDQSKSEQKPSQLEHTMTDYKQEEERSTGRFRPANFVNRRTNLRISTQTSEIRKDINPNNRPEGLRSGRLRSRISPRISPRIRSTTGMPLKAETIEDSLTSTFKVKPKFADFKESFMEKLLSAPKKASHRINHRVNTITKTTATSSNFITTGTPGLISTKFKTTTEISASSVTSLSTSTARTTIFQTEMDDSTTPNEVSITDDRTTSTPTESIAVNTIIDDAVEFVTQTTSDKFNGKSEWAASKHDGGRKIPEIGDPAVEEKLNRLTIGKNGNSRRQRKPDITSARKRFITRSRGTIRTNESLDASNGESKKADTADVPKMGPRSAIRSRIRRPPGVKHQFRPSSFHQGKVSNLPKSIKRMRIKSQDKKVASVEPIISDDTEMVNSTVNPKTVRPPRIRVSTGRRAPSSHTSPLKTNSVTPVRRLRNPTGRRGQPTTTTTTATTITTTEKITISPNAHKISYTLNNSEYADNTSDIPMLMVEDIPIVSNSLEYEPGQPNAAELSSVPYLIPDNIFSQATHQLMKAKKPSTKIFLPTLVPLVRKTPTISTVSPEVPVVGDGTSQTEENLEVVSEKMLPKPVKRGR